MINQNLFFQITTAQILSYVSRNAPGQIITNQPMPAQTITNGQFRTNNALRTGNGMPYIANNVPNTPITNGPIIANSLANTPIANVLNEQAIANQIVDAANIGPIDTAALANMANVNGNVATFNLGNGGFTVTSGSPGVPGFGINVLADALEVGGRVAVNGQIPIFGAVSLNGYLPTDGAASVSYTCGGQTAGPTVGPTAAPTVLDGVVN